MKKLCIIIQNQNKIVDLEPALTDLKKMGVDILGYKEDRRGSVNAPLREFEPQDMLILTDIPHLASLLAVGDYPVLVYVHDGNRDKSLPGVKYVIEGFEDVNGEYFIRVWQRLTEKAWFITETDRCIIRETAECDVDAFYEIYSDPSITEYMEPLFEDREAELKYVKDYREKVYDFYGFGMWTVLDKETGRVIGRAGVSMREGFDDPELGFMIAKEYQNQGLATEVCRAILSFANREFEFDRFQALVHKDNTASQKLLTKLGFVYSETVRVRDEELQLFILKR
jgi:RimJ/RimL family protein N-acetyltransferase